MKSPLIEKLEEQLDQLPEEAKGTELEVDILLELAWEISLSNIERATDITEQGQALAEKLEYEKGIAFSLRNIGYLQSIGKTNLQEGLATLEDALKRVRALENEREAEAAIIDTIGYAYHQLGSYDRALENYLISLNIYQEIQNTRGEAWGMHNLARIYKVNGDISRSIEHDLKSLTLFREINYVTGISLILFTLGESFRSIGDMKKALQSHLESEELFATENMAFGLSRAQTAIAEIYSEMGKDDEALKYFQKAEKNNEVVPSKDVKSTTLASLGFFYLKRNQLSEAEQYLQDALKMMDGTDAKPALKRIHDGLYQVYKQQGKPEIALVNLEILMTLNEQIQREESQTRMEKMQIQMELEKAEQEAEIHRLRYIELAEMQASLIQSEKLALLGNLVAGIAHEVNNPIGVINSITDVSNRAIQKIHQEIEQFSSNEETPQTGKLEKTISILKRNNEATLEAGNRIVDLVGRLKNFVRLDEADLQLIDIHTCLDDTLALLCTQKPDRIQVKTQYTDIPKVRCYPSQLNQVFMTLLTNAMDAIEEDGKITVSTNVEDGNCLVRIEDTGKGIPEDKLNSLFEIGFGNKDQAVRMSVGLANVQNVVQKHDGKISVESTIGVGTTFYIKLPFK